jgi:broad specificity phosphatase PhoE
MNTLETAYPTPASEALEATLTTTAENTFDTTSQEYTLYFIRHGEALHNILEKDAASAARDRAISDGHSPNSSYVQHAMEEARQAILNNQSMQDPPLSESGMKEAQCAKRELENVILHCNLPPVQEVWVSPLQRALKTASIIFPDTSSTDNVESSRPIIRVKEELEERRTGLACDTATPLKSIQRPSFQYFSLSGLRLKCMEQMISGVSASSSMEKMGCLDEEGVNENIVDDLNSDFGLFRLSGHSGEEDLWEQLENGGVVVSDGLTNTDCKNTQSRNNDTLIGNIIDGCNTKKLYQKEDREMLRDRTKKLFDLLTKTESRSICLIGE